MPKWTENWITEVIIDGKKRKVGINTNTENPITPETIERGKEGWANNEKIIGTMDGYNVVQRLVGENDCILELRKVGLGASDTTITNRNIKRYKQQDLQRISLTGGIMASDKEYEIAEEKMQEIYKKVMGVI